jgi:hypothetical protein
MQKEDWQHIVKLMGLVYVPIVILVVVIFILVEINSAKISAYKTAHQNEGVSASSTP